MFMRYLKLLLILSFCFYANTTFAADDKGENDSVLDTLTSKPPPNPPSVPLRGPMTEYRHRPLQPARDYLFLLSPTVGTFNSTINLNGINAPTIGNIRDISGGFGLFGLFTTPHADFSNLFFRTDIDGSYGLDLPKITGNPFAPIVPITESFDTVGNLFYVNTYLNKDDCVTPNIGFGYFYHRIKGQYTTVTVTEPIAKLGLRFNLKGLRLVWNPYISYAWDRTDVAIRNGAMAVDTKASNDSLIYGTNLRWRWRMIQSELRYSYKDSLVGKKNAHAFGLQTSVFFNAWSGISANFNYRNGVVCRERSFMVGPVFAF